jgi:tRNA modification GTPase
LRQTEDPVEQEGVRRSRQAMEEAQLLLLLLDGSAPLTGEDRALLAQPSDQPRLILVNKSDLPQALDETALAAALSPQSRPEPQPRPSPVMRLSARTGEGLDRLRDAIRGALLRNDFEPGESPTVTRLRHQTSLARAGEALAKALESVEGALPSECVAMDLRAGIEALGEITGAVTTEDILDRIFRDFCIGK